MANLRHVGIPVYNLEKMTRWYCDMFKLKLLQVTEEDDDYIGKLYDHAGHLTTAKLIDKNGVVLELLQYTSGYQKEVVPHVAFTVKEHGDFSRAYSENNPEGKACVAFVKDPEGNLLELVQEL